MIKVFVMPTCPDCTKVIAQVKDNPEYVIIDIGAHVRNLKEFLYLRDNDPVFDAAKSYGPSFTRPRMIFISSSIS